jgi:hypothetical protein
MNEPDDAAIRDAMHQWDRSRNDGVADERLHASMSSGSYRHRPRSYMAVAGIGGVVVAAALAGWIITPRLLHLRPSTNPLPAGLTSTPAASATAGPSATPSATPTPRATPPLQASVCAGSQLTAVLTNAGGAGGYASQEFTFKNISDSTCTLMGYPSVQLLDQDNQPVVTHASDGPGYIVQPETVTLVTLLPGGDASFVTGTFEYTSGEACPNASMVAITPPGTATTLTVSVAVLASDPCGAIDVSPVYPARDRSREEPAFEASCAVAELAKRRTVGFILSVASDRYVLSRRAVKSAIAGPRRAGGQASRQDNVDANHWGEGLGAQG